LHVRYVRDASVLQGFICSRVAESAPKKQGGGR